ncbi:MAG TPA: tetratricopeptide repeat protein [bacterium]|nr:tetratricopeptide repeat protein [bacterium]
MPSFRKLSPATILLTALLFVPLFAQQQIPLDALLRGGRVQYGIGNYTGARERFSTALAQYGATAADKDLANIHLLLGLCDAQLKLQDSAASHFATAMDKDTAVVSKIRADEQWQYLAWNSLITSTRDNYDAGVNDAALRYALGALKVDPSKSQTYALVAGIYSALGRYDDMYATAGDLLKLDAGVPEAFSLLGQYFLEKPDSLWPAKEPKTLRLDSADYYYDKAIAAYEKRFAAAKADLAKQLKPADTVRLNQITAQIIDLSRKQDQSELKRYIERDLNAAGQLTQVAQIAGRLLYAANNLNVANSRAGTAMLRATADTKADTSERFRAKAEMLFKQAVQYDSTDLVSLFNLGITQYQGKEDTLAESSLQTVIDHAVAPVGALNQPWIDSLLALVTSTESGYVQIPGPLTEKVDSVLASRGRKTAGFGWLFTPNLDSRKLNGHATVADTAGMFLSTQVPQLVEQAFLWLGSCETGLANSLSDKGRKEVAKATYERAIGNLLIATKLGPNNSDAFQNLGICYRETDQKDKALKAFENADTLRKQGR